MTYINGVKYDGEWDGEEKCGQGKLVYPNGLEVEGQWWYGQLKGEVSVTKPGGSIRKV